MFHLINKFWTLSHQVNNLVLVGLSVYDSHELGLGGVSQETGHRLDWEIDCHDVIVFLNFNVTRVVFEEHVRVSTLVWAHDFFDIWQSYSKLIDQSVNIKALNNIAKERVSLQITIHLL